MPIHARRLDALFALYEKITPAAGGGAPVGRELHRRRYQIRPIGAATLVAFGAHVV